MPLLIGIDEAGLGPILGPLVVSGVALRNSHAQFSPQNHAPQLWDVLRDTCSRTLAQAARKLIIADSKQVYTSRLGLAGLERAVLVTLAACDHRPRTWRSLLRCVAPHAENLFNAIAWYAGRDLDLPAHPATGDIGTRANALHRNLKQAEWSLVDVASEPMTAGDFNQLIRKLDNKSTLLIGQVMRVVHRLLSQHDDRQVHLQVDRLGGRTHYREVLMTAFPHAELTVVEEREGRSAYFLQAPNRQLLFEFLTKGDDLAFPVALASMYSKYLRELYMKIFNAYWCERQPDLKPTAGYYNDAKRWLRDAEQTLRAANLPPGMLVRER